ncbi:MAG: tRNA-binding protein [Gammaproteobacteria bacterium]|nr:tRNA-binding protein [Gammaproteobacteria bacterium]
MSTTISFDNFTAVEICAGTVLNAVPNEKAKKPAYVLTIDFGPHGIKTSSAQLTKNYTVQELIGRQIVAVMNFEPKRVAGIKSEVLVLGCDSEETDIVLLQPTKPVPNGSRVA